jgi:hypothetical protein
MSYRLAFWTTLFCLLPTMETSASIIGNYADTHATVAVFVDPGFDYDDAAQGDLAGASVTATLNQLFSTVTSSFSGSDLLSVSLAQRGFGGSEDYLTGYAVGGFHALTDMAYDISGTVLSSGSDYTVLEGSLQDTTTGASIFYSHQESLGDASFTLGLEEGNYLNALVGSPSGFLQAGHNYYWYSFVRSDEITGTPLFTTGNMEIRFSEVSAVPEPSSLLFSSLGGMGFLWRRRLSFRRNRK